MTLPTILTIGCTFAFLIFERVFPGRALPPVAGWYLRAVAINLAQLVITISTGRIWINFFAGGSLFNLWSLQIPYLEGFVGWLLGTFVFYWWHRLRHKKAFWRVFHQIHHSPARIEVFTSFYKHPFEILTNSILSAIVLFPLLGCSLLGSFWYNFFAATGEYFYHANVATPKWLRFIIQTPELHSIHHQYDLHSFNYGDIPLWDRLFGTYRDTVEFMPRCGFPDGVEQRAGEMLLCRDVYLKSYA
jgi:sterol desaturase/sphingolipid hydroxylase (fatty acid hydroxylase superfamily)